MKKLIRFRTLFLSVLLLAFGLSAQAQKDFRKNNIIQYKELPPVKAHITKEIEAQIIDIVAPVKEKIEALYNADNTGTYESYKKEVLGLAQIKESKEKAMAAKALSKKYYPFVKSIWDKAKIDEAYYQEKLKSIFPANVKETIRFGEFLNFSMKGVSKKPTPQPPPPPAPNPASICVDANTLFQGAKALEGGAIGGADVVVAPARPPSPPEIVVTTDAVVMGVYKSEGWLHNKITIPGTFPFDSKVLRCKKNYDWSGWGFCFSIVGCSWATAAYSTNANASDFSTDGEIYSVVAPVTFYAGIDQKSKKNEETLVPKTDLRTAQFGITCFASSAASVFLAYSHSNSSMAMWKWDICEE